MDAYSFLSYWFATCYFNTIYGRCYDSLHSSSEYMYNIRLQQIIEDKMSCIIDEQKIFDWI